jgi:hypothetical protein
MGILTGLVKHSTNTNLITQMNYMDTIKQFVLNLDFVQDFRHNGYLKGKEDGIQETAHNDAYILSERVNERVASLLGTVDEKKIIKTDEKKGFIFIGDEMVLPEMAHNLKQEAEIIAQTDLWKLMVNTLRASAHKRVFIDSKEINDIMAGKMALYNLSLLEKIIHICKNHK